VKVIKTFQKFCETVPLSCAAIRVALGERVTSAVKFCVLRREKLTLAVIRATLT
jgi:hypothetical protein